MMIATLALLLAAAHAPPPAEATPPTAAAPPPPAAAAPPAARPSHAAPPPSAGQRPSAAAPPAQMNWYWLRTFQAPERPKASNAGAAFLAMSFYLVEGRPAIVNPRRAPLVLPPNTYRMAVVRIDHNEAKFTTTQRTELARMIAEIPALTRTHSLQIDFDAPQSAWPFYKALLADVRRATGPDVFLSITALASWCTAGSWMSGLPVDEIVPMFFRMGRQRIDPPLAFPACQLSAGISVDEPGVRLPATVKRVYTFQRDPTP